MAFDWNDPVVTADPCLVAAELRRLYLERIRAGSVKLVRTKSLDNEREGQWYDTNLDDLRGELQRQEDACRVKQGLPPLSRRFAMTAGARRTFTRFPGC